MFCLFGNNKREQLEKEKKEKAERLRRLNRVAEDARFPGEVPEVGKKVQFVHYDENDDIFISEGVVMGRNYFISSPDGESDEKEPSREILVIISAFMNSEEASEQDFLIAVFKMENREWTCSSPDGSEYEAVLNILD